MQREMPQRPCNPAASCVPKYQKGAVCHSSQQPEKCHCVLKNTGRLGHRALPLCGFCIQQCKSARCAGTLSGLWQNRTGVGRVSGLGLPRRELRQVSGFQVSAPHEICGVGIEDADHPLPSPAPVREGSAVCPSWLTTVSSLPSEGPTSEGRTRHWDPGALYPRQTCLMCLACFPPAFSSLPDTLHTSMVPADGGRSGSFSGPLG